jgi:hypothetical protein
VRQQPVDEQGTAAGREPWCRRSAIRGCGCPGR